MWLTHLVNYGRHAERDTYKQHAQIGRAHVW
jgi:hypothetical protein